MNLQSVLSDLMKVFLAFYIVCCAVGRADIPLRFLTKLRVAATDGGGDPMKAKMNAAGDSYNLPFVLQRLLAPAPAHPTAEVVSGVRESEAPLPNDVST